MITKFSIYENSYDIKVFNELKVGDQMICISCYDSEDYLIYGKTYIIEELKSCYRQIKLEGVPYYWETNRFLQRKDMTQEEVQKYDDIMTERDSEKYNL